MPPLPRLRVAALEDLFAQLRFAPPETLRRQLLRAEALCSEIDPAQNYPEDWVVFRVTGFRPEIEAPATIVGSALLRDLVAMCERLSAGAGFTAAELPPSAFLTTEELLERWSVSRKTLDRLRREGLPARRVPGDSGKVRLLFEKARVETFEAAQAERLRRAASFARMGPDLEARIIRRAEVYRRKLGLTLNQAAKRLSDRFDRAHETVRQLLLRHDTSRPDPIFRHRGPPSPRERTLIERAHFLAIEPADVARKLNRSLAAVHRAINEARARRLRALALRPGQRDREGKGILEQPAVREGLGLPGHTDLAALVSDARAAGPSIAAIERARAAAYHALLDRAARAIAALPRSAPGALALDRIETDLRWAARLKAELVRSEIPLLLRTIESAAGPFESLPPHTARHLIDIGFAALAEAVDAFDSIRGGRLAAPAGLLVNKAVAKALRTPKAALAAQPPAESPRDWTLAVSPWQLSGARLWLEPPAAARARAATLPEPWRRVLLDRMGWPESPRAGSLGPPRTLAEIAEQRSTTIIHAARMEREALRRCRA